MLFDEQISRKPNLYPWTEEFIDVMWRNHWTPNEFDFISDLQQYKVELTDAERNVVKNTLSAIGQIEIAVKKFWSRLGDNIPHPSITDMGLVMANIEVIHNKAYEKLLDVLQLHDVFEENLKLDIIQGRVKYLRKYLEKNYKDNNKQYIYALILFTLFVENVSLFSQFYVILWLNRNKNYLKDTTQQVQYTKNEELIHAQIGIKLVQTAQKDYPKLFDSELAEKVAQEAKEAYKAESKIVDWMLGDYEGPGLSKLILKEFIKDRINESLAQIGFEKVFEINDELIRQTRWMDEEIYGNAKTDFFHKRPTDYATMEVSPDQLF